MVLSGRGVPPVTIVDLDKGLYNILRNVLGAVRPSKRGGTLHAEGAGRGVFGITHLFVSSLGTPTPSPALRAHMLTNRHTP